MKLTKSQLKQIIKEELTAVLSEQPESAAESLADHLEGAYNESDARRMAGTSMGGSERAFAGWLDEIDTSSPEVVEWTDQQGWSIDQFGAQIDDILNQAKAIASSSNASGKYSDIERAQQDSGRKTGLKMG